MPARWSRPLVTLAVLLVPLAGCIGLNPAGSHGCHATPGTVAVWEDSEASTEIRTLDTAEPYRPSAGFNATVEPWNRSGDGAAYVVDLVKWDVSSRVDGSSAEGMRTFVLRDNGRVNVQLPASVSDEQVRELFETFAGTVTDAGDATLADWAHAFVASREEVPAPGPGSAGFSTTIPAPFEIDDVVRNLADQDPQHLGVPGVARVDGAAWALRLVFPYERVVDGLPAGVESLSADALDRVVLELSASVGEGSDVVEPVADAYEVLGVDADPPRAGSIRVDSPCAPS